MSRIVKFEAENVKRLKAVSITPEGNMVVLRGNNGQGKSSVLDAIEYALAGEKSHPAIPIREGADKARIVIETDDGIVVERRFTRGGTRLEVRSKDGVAYKSPQKLLDGLIGKLAFDPLAFMREKPERQVEILRELVGVDFSALDAKRRQCFDARTDINRSISQAKARLATIKVEEAPDALLSAADLLDEQDRRRQQYDKHESQRRKLQEVRDRFKMAEREIVAAKAKIEAAEKALAEMRQLLARDEEQLAKLKADGQALRTTVETLVDPDLEEIPVKIREIEGINERVRHKQAHAHEQAILEQQEADAAQLTDDIAAINRQKADLLTQANFSIPGLGFGEGEIIFNGLPLQAASSAEQLRVSVAMGLALNPKLKIMSIRERKWPNKRAPKSGSKL